MGVLSRVLRSRVRDGEYRRRPVHAVQAGIRRRLILALLAAALPAGHAAAQPLPTARDAVPGARLAGRGRLRYWGFDVYDAELWIAPGFRPDNFASHAFALELAYLRELEGAAIARRSLQEMRRAGEFSASDAARWEAALRAVLPDIRKGDRVTGVNRPGEGALFLVNGRPAGAVADPVFAALFFAIWLGPATSEPALRQQLLAQAAP